MDRWHDLCESQSINPSTSAVPLMLPQPVQASHPGPAGYPGTLSPFAGLLFTGPDGGLVA